MTTTSAPSPRPGFRLLNQISTTNLKGDLFGGVTAAIVALPLSLAFGVASGAGPAAGLWGAVLVGLFAALFGGTPTLISEPTGPMTVVMTAVIASLTAQAPDRETGMAMAFTVVMLAGLLQIVFGLLKLGRYITQMPYTVISGFMSGIGLILIILQIGPFLGQAIPRGGVLGTLNALPGLIAGARPAEVTLAVVTLAILWLTPAGVKRIAPPQLIALVVGTLLSLTLLDGGGDYDLGIRRIGEIASGFPGFHPPHFELPQLRLMLIDAVVLGMLGCIDALLTAVIADSITRTEHDSNKELIGQGLGNLASGLFGGIAGAGATMGTVVNIQAGGRSALSGISRALILMAVILAGGRLAGQIPHAVLAGIALKVGVDIVDWGFLKRAHRISVKGAVIMYLVIALTVLVDLIVAVGVGVFIANIITIDKLTGLQSKSVKSISTGDGDLVLDADERALLDQGRGQVLLFQLTGAMIFGVAKAIAREHNAIGDCRAVIFDLTEVSHLGVTAALAVENAVEEAIEKGRQVFVVGASGTTQRRLEKLGLYARIPAERSSISRRDALQQAVEAVVAAAPGRGSPQPFVPADAAG